MSSLFIWWLVLEALGLTALPLVSAIFSARADHGYAFGKIAALLVVSYVSWLLTCTGLVALRIALPLTVAGFVGLNATIGWRRRHLLGDWLRGPGRRAILIHTTFWTFGFLFFAWQRSLAPEIFGGEKYMDFAFFNTLTRTDVMPPQDMWMAGKPVNYYYFGYLMLANLARLTPVPNHVAYNLCVATAGGLGFAEMAAIGLMLNRRLPLALLTGVMAMLIGNLDGMVQLVARRGLVGFDYYHSSRIVGNGDTINEFPYFTTIFGDLHPHFIVLPVTILLLALLLDPGGVRRRTATWHAVPVAFVLASMIAISPWELPVGTLVAFLLLGCELAVFSPSRLRIGLFVIGMLVAAYVLYLPAYLHFVQPTGGVGFRFARTSLLEFLTVFGALLVPAALFLGAEIGATTALSPERRQLLLAVGVLIVAVSYLGAGNAVFPILLLFGGAALACAMATGDSERRAPLLLLVGASLALLACELVYVKGPYDEPLYRSNTVFKLYFQSWLLLSIATPWCWAQLVAKTGVSQNLRRVALVSGGALFLASCAYPIEVTATRLTDSRAPRTLDGTAYLAREHADDFAAIKWIREIVPDLPVILEATGKGYTYSARFSSNTGLPTLLGWANHEALWRNRDPEIRRRARDIAEIYSAPQLAGVENLLDQYHVKYIVVGALERQDYFLYSDSYEILPYKFQPAGLEKFAQLKVAFAHGGTTIYQR